MTRAWPDAVGPAIAGAAWPQRIARDGTLHVNTASSTWAFELDRMGEEVLGKLRAALGDATPPALRFAPGPLPAAGPVERGGAAAFEPTAADAEEAAALSAAIEDPEPPRGGAESRRREPRGGASRPHCLIYFIEPAKPLFCRHFLLSGGL